MSDSSPGWQPDPTGKHDHRYWDGSEWTENVSDAGVAGTDPYDATTGGATDAGDPTVASDPVDPTMVTPGPPAPDATAAWPTTPGAPAPPPPYVPTGPVSPGDGGSKKGLLIGGGILAAVVIAVLAFLALGNDDKKDEVRRADDSAATSTTDDSTTTSTKDGSTDGSDGAGTYGSDPALDALYDACEGGDYQACDDLYTDSPFGSEYENFGNTCGERNEAAGYCVDIYEGGSDGGGTGGLTDSANLPEGFGDSLADFYEESLGLARDKAECLAGKLEDAVKDGNLGEDEAFSQVFDYLSECDISMEEISGN